MKGAACGAGNSYSSGEPDFASNFHRGSCGPVICVLILSFDCSFCLIAWYLYFYSLMQDSFILISYFMSFHLLTHLSQFLLKFLFYGFNIFLPTNRIVVNVSCNLVVKFML